jgi:hypothetical protein
VLRNAKRRYKTLVDRCVKDYDTILLTETQCNAYGIPFKKDVAKEVHREQLTASAEKSKKNKEKAAAKKGTTTGEETAVAAAITTSPGNKKLTGKDAAAAIIASSGNKKNEKGTAPTFDFRIPNPRVYETEGIYYLEASPTPRKKGSTIAQTSSTNGSTSSKEGRAASAKSSEERKAERAADIAKACSRRKIERSLHVPWHIDEDEPIDFKEELIIEFKKRPHSALNQTAIRELEGMCELFENLQQAVEDDSDKNYILEQLAKACDTLFLSYARSMRGNMGLDSAMGRALDASSDSASAGDYAEEDENEYEDGDEDYTQESN